MTDNKQKYSIYHLEDKKSRSKWDGNKIIDKLATIQICLFVILLNVELVLFRKHANNILDTQYSPYDQFITFYDTFWLFWDISFVSSHRRLVFILSRRTYCWQVHDYDILTLFI